MIAGGTAAALTTPLDVIKTRVMLEAKVSRTIAWADSSVRLMPREPPHRPFCHSGRA